MQEKLSGPKASEIATSFAGQGMMATLGAELVEAAPGRVVIAAPIRPEVGQQHGFAHAALAFALGDSAAGYAALSLMPEGAEVLTVEMKINLLAPAAGERLVATGEVVRAGRRLSVVKAEVVAVSGGAARPVALLQGTMIPA
jgi:uncharacterized protein (TIGR00369 family)